MAHVEEGGGYDSGVNLDYGTISANVDINTPQAGPIWGPGWRVGTGVQIAGTEFEMLSPCFRNAIGAYVRIKFRFSVLAGKAGGELNYGHDNKYGAHGEATFHAVSAGSSVEGGLIGVTGYEYGIDGYAFGMGGALGGAVDFGKDKFNPTKNLLKQLAKVRVKDLRYKKIQLHGHGQYIQVLDAKEISCKPKKCK